jgi:oxygen-independent coproporphyrinogen-3 oxidase
MAGIYIHIPFCKQRCYYCDFHFSTSLKHKDTILNNMRKELINRKGEINSKVETIYFGGGSPSIIESEKLENLINTVYENFEVIDNPEITVEANPDDINIEKINQLKRTRVNRISLGVQSFFDDDLKFMNRAHNSTQAIESIKLLIDNGYDNITADLIYGIPNQAKDKWIENINIMTSIGVKHISAYALTVEKNTPLFKLIERGKYPKVEDEKSHEDFIILTKMLKSKGYDHYEVSNFAQKNYISKHNSAYWFNEEYLGIGPSAHSFDGKTRRWNIASNKIYREEFDSNNYFEQETLSEKDKLNELIMTRLRTKWGLNLEEVEEKFGSKSLSSLIKNANKHIENGNLFVEENKIKVSEKGMFFADGISSDLFEV